MDKENISIGMRVQVTSLIGFSAGDVQRIDRIFRHNRCPDVIGTVTEKLENCEDAWLVTYTKEERNAMGDLIGIPYRAAYRSKELKEMFQLPFEPLPFDDSLVRWLDKSGDNND
jgi:hypothetical protein